MGADQRMRDRRRLRPGLLRDVLVGFPPVAGKALGVIENAALAAEPRAQPARHRGIGGAQIHPEGLAAFGRQFEGVERRPGGRLDHVGLIGMPLQLAVAETADRAAEPVLQVGEDRDLGDRGRGPVAAHGALERSEQGAEPGELGLAQRLAAEYQDSPVRPQCLQLGDRHLVERLPERQPLDLTGERLVQRARPEAHHFSPRYIGG